MNLRQLQHVKALTEYRNFGRAANALGITQSALTQSIKNLEAEYRVELFDRSKRDVIPTAYGAAFIESAKQILRQMGNLERELDQMKNLQSGRLVINCNTWSAEALVGPALSRMLVAYPGLRFSVRTGSDADAFDRLLDGEFDLYVGLPQQAPDNRIVWQDLSLPSLVLVCRPDHPLTALTEIHARDCLSFPIAVPRLSHWYYDWITHQIGDPFASIQEHGDAYFVECDDFSVIRKLIKTTDVITCMLQSMVTDETEHGLLKVIELPELNFRIPISIGYPSRHPLSPAGTILLNEIMDEAGRISTSS